SAAADDADQRTFVGPVARPAGRWTLAAAAGLLDHAAGGVSDLGDAQLRADYPADSGLRLLSGADRTAERPPDADDIGRAAPSVRPAAHLGGDRFWGVGLGLRRAQPALRPGLDFRDLHRADGAVRADRAQPWDAGPHTRA